MKRFPDLRSRLFAGVFPAGINYADKSQQQDGDYKRVAFLPFASLKLEVYSPRSPLLPLVREDAAAIQARRGELFAVSTCGQTVLLGGPLPDTLCAEFRADLKALAARCGKTPEQVYALWREYCETYSDQSKIWSEFLEWYGDRLGLKARIEQVAAVILDKWENGDGSQVGDAEDYDLSEADFEAAMKIAHRQWAPEAKRQEVC